MTELMTTKQVAKHFGVTERNVRYATGKGLLGAIQKIGWQHVYDRNKLPKKWPVRSKKANGSKTVI